VVLFDNLARDWLYRDVHNGLRVLTAGQPRSPLGDEIKQDVYFIERQSEFRRNGKFR
jgi:hypothetical protein